MPQRSTEEVFNDHLELAQKYDTQTDLKRNFSPGCIMLTSYVVFRGHEGAKDTADLLEKQICRTRYTYHTKMVEGDIAFLEWSAVSERARIEDGADTFLIRNGLIEIMTIHYTLQN